MYEHWRQHHIVNVMYSQSNFNQYVKLIEAVGELPCLWQISSHAYKDLRAKENSWKVVASKVSLDEHLLL